MTDETEPEMVPIHVALARVMRDVQQIAKTDQTQATGKYMYRGVDTVMNECGPVLRKHGVIAVPRVLSITSRDIRTSNDKPSHEVIVEVEFTFYGPKGDSIVGSAYGESADSNDKATSQAMSVALRTFYLQALCIPTGDVDPDENDMQRGGQRSQGSVTGPKMSTADAKAVERGWDTAAQQEGAWDALLRAQNALDDDFKAEIISWGRDEKLNPQQFTRAQAEHWQGLIDAARAEVAEATESATAKITEAFPEGGEAAADMEAPFETAEEAAARKNHATDPIEPDTEF